MTIYSANSFNDDQPYILRALIKGIAKFHLIFYMESVLGENQIELVNFPVTSMSEKGKVIYRNLFVSNFCASQFFEHIGRVSWRNS